MRVRGGHGRKVGVADVHGALCGPDGDFIRGVRVRVPRGEDDVVGGWLGGGVGEVGREDVAVVSGRDVQGVGASEAEDARDVLALAFLEEGVGAPAAGEDVVLEVAALGRGEGEDVKRVGEEVGREEAALGALVGAAEGQADEPGVEERRGEHAREMGGCAGEVEFEAVEEDLLDELDGETFQTGLGRRLWRVSTHCPITVLCRGPIEGNVVRGAE